MVTGGWDASRKKQIATTEIMSGTAPGGWRSVGRLPSARNAPRGITVANMIFVTGGRARSGAVAEILQFDPTSEEWVVTGQMKKERYAHAVTVMPFGLINEMCI